jgi:hypothetical protein
MDHLIILCYPSLEHAQRLIEAVHDGWMDESGDVSCVAIMVGWGGHQEMGESERG